MMMFRTSITCRHVVVMVALFAIAIPAAACESRSSTMTNHNHPPVMVVPNRRRPIRTVFQERTQRASAEALSAAKALQAISDRLDTDCSKIVKIQEMALQVLNVRVKCESFFSLADRVDKSAKLLSNVPTIGEPFQILKSPLEQLLKQRGKISKLLETLQNHLYNEKSGLITKLGSSSVGAQSFFKLCGDFSGTLDDVGRLCRKLRDHVDIVPLGDAYMTTDFHNLELNLWTEKQVLNLSVEPFNDAGQVLEEVLRYRKSINQLDQSFDHVMASLTGIDEFLEDFFEYVGGPIGRGAAWLEWFFGASNAENRSMEWLIPDTVKQQLQYAAKNLDPFREETMEELEGLANFLSSTAVVDRWNVVLTGLADPTFIHGLQDIQVRINSHLEDLFYRLQILYTVAQRIVLCATVVVVPLTIASLVSFFNQRKVYEVPTVAKAMLMALSRIMVPRDRRLPVPFWTALPYWLLLSDVVEGRREAIPVDVLAIFTGIFYSMNKGFLLRLLVRAVPSLVQYEKNDAALVVVDNQEVAVASSEP